MVQKTDLNRKWYLTALSRHPFYGHLKAREVGYIVILHNDVGFTVDLKVLKIWRAKLRKITLYSFRLTSPLQGTAANIRMNLILPESRVPRLHVCSW